MINVRIDKDELNSNHKWLVVERPGIRTHQVKIESDEEALQIIHALQHSVQRTLLTCATHGEPVSKLIHFECGCSVIPQSG